MVGAALAPVTSVVPMLSVLPASGCYSLRAAWVKRLDAAKQFTLLGRKGSTAMRACSIDDHPATFDHNSLS